MPINIDVALYMVNEDKLEARASAPYKINPPFKTHNSHILLYIWKNKKTLQEIG
jgi:hypothetical protein